MTQKQKTDEPTIEQILTEEMARKLISRIVVKRGCLFLAGEGGGELSVIAQGEPGEKGKDGVSPQPPKHKWDEKRTKVRFSNPDGTWGDWSANLTGTHGQNGKSGKTPVKNVDYFDGKDGKNGYTPVKDKDYRDGIDGVDGKDGKNGYTPVKGKDYRDGVDGKDGKNGYTPVKGKDYRDGVDGKNGYTPVKGKDYRDGIDGKDGKNGGPGILPSEIINLITNINSLKARVKKLEKE